MSIKDVKRCMKAAGVSLKTGKCHGASSLRSHLKTRQHRVPLKFVKSNHEKLLKSCLIQIHAE